MRNPQLCCLLSNSKESQEPRGMDPPPGVEEELEESCDSCEPAHKRRCVTPDGPQRSEELFAWPHIWQHLPVQLCRALQQKSDAKTSVIITTSYSGLGSAEIAAKMFMQDWGSSLKQK